MCVRDREGKCNVLQWKRNYVKFYVQSEQKSGIKCIMITIIIRPKKHNYKKTRKVSKKQQQQEKSLNNTHRRKAVILCILDFFAKKFATKIFDFYYLRSIEHGMVV